MTDSLASSRITLEVLFSDVDSMHVVYHAHYFRYFEAARSRLLASIGYDYPAMADSGYLWPIIECKCRYIKPLRYGMTFSVLATLTEVRNRLKITYEITDVATDERICKGHTIQVAVEAESGEMRLESPPVLLKKVGVCP